MVASPTNLGFLARQTDAAGTGEEWRRPERIKAWYLDSAVDDSSVVWDYHPTANPPWRQTWPEPMPTQEIGQNWVSVNSQPGIDKITWRPVIDAHGTGFTPTKGDLIVRYTAEMYYIKGQPIPKPVAWNGDDLVIPPGATSIRLTTRQTDNVWDIAAQLGTLGWEVGDLQEFVVAVTAHYEFHDGTGPVDQDPPVMRTAYQVGKAPVQPLPPPPAPTIEWITDAGIGVGTQTGAGHFRFAPTVADMLLIQPRPPVDPTIEYEFPAMGNQPAATLPQASRQVTLSWTEQVVATRPAVAPTTRTVYDFVAADGLPAIQGSPDSQRKATVVHEESITTNMDPRAFGGARSIGYTLQPGEVLRKVEWDLKLNGAADVDDPANPGTKIPATLTDPPLRSIQLVMGGDTFPLSAGGGADDTEAKGERIVKKGVTSGDVRIELAKPDPATGDPDGWLAPFTGTVQGTVKFTVLRPVTHLGVARQVTEPWDGVPGHPGDPGQTATGQQTHTQVVEQSGIQRIKPWDGINGHPGDPGAPADTTRKSWSWPFNFSFGAVPNAAKYQYNVNGEGWTDVPNVPPTATGPAATGTVTIPDLWRGIAPGGGVTILVRALKAGPPPDPGFANTATSNVPRFPTIGPVRNLAPVSAGYRFATTKWDPPTIDPAAVHYLSGEYVLSAPGGAQRRVATRTDYIDMGKPADRPLGPYETTVPAPAEHNYIASGYPADPGAPAVDASRSATLTVVPVAGWGATGPATTTPITLLPRFVRFDQQVIQNVRQTPVVVTKDPDTLTYPPAQVWSLGLNPPGQPANPQFVRDRIAGPDPESFSTRTNPGTIQMSQVIGASAGVANVDILAQFNSVAFPLPPGARAAFGWAGSWVEWHFTVRGGRIVGFIGATAFQVDGNSRTYQYTSLGAGANSVNWTWRSMFDGDGPAHGQPWMSVGGEFSGYPTAQAAYEAGVNLTGLRVTAITGFAVYGLWFGCRVQPDPILNIGATHRTPGNFWPAVVRYQPTENRP